MHVNTLKQKSEGNQRSQANAPAHFYITRLPQVVKQHGAVTWGVRVSSSCGLQKQKTNLCRRWWIADIAGGAD
jgi:hypothetical protein